jgi:hypothetical protein
MKMQSDTAGTSSEKRANFSLLENSEKLLLSLDETAILFETDTFTIDNYLREIAHDKNLPPGAIRGPYDLDIIFEIGYRMRSIKGVQFRQWATQKYKNFLIKGFSINSDRLKLSVSNNHVDKLTDRIRDIQFSDHRFHDQLSKLLAQSVASQGEIDDFITDLRGKIFFAITGKTSAEIVVLRADSSQPNMGLQKWKDACLQKADVTVSTNYLWDEEIRKMNRFASMFIDYAEDRAEKRKNITLLDWRKYVDNFLEFNERPLLKGNGRVSHDNMVKLAHERYEEFDAKRCGIEALKVDVDDIAELETVEKANLKERYKNET